MSTLVKKVMQGDKVALFHFYQQYAPKIRRYVASRIPNTSDPDDFVQEIFFEAIDTIAFLKNEDNVLNWLYRIAKNKVADYYRRKKVKQVLLSQMPFLEIIDKEVHEPDFIFEKNKLRDKIEATLNVLPQQQQKILRLRYEDDLSVKQIAFTLNLSFKATESLLFRARKNFQETYERT